MSENVFRISVAAVGLAFAVIFCVVVVPPLLESGDVVGAALAGFVNPYASGYSSDTILCWVVLAIWVVYESKSLSIRHGWIALLIGLVPGVATGFALYLILRSRQLQEAT
ncbi:MAG: DUF2834 domain-containing protein [bacterium]|nr:DUF2834 domain-containing protein [bacterium]